MKQIEKFSSCSRVSPRRFSFPGGTVFFFVQLVFSISSLACICISLCRRLGATYSAAWALGSDFNAHSRHFRWFFGAESGTSDRAKDPFQDAFQDQCPVGATRFAGGLRPNQTDSPTGSFWWSFHGSCSSCTDPCWQPANIQSILISFILHYSCFLLAISLRSTSLPRRVLPSSQSPESLEFPRRLLCQITYTPLTFYALVLSQLNF